MNSSLLAGRYAKALLDYAIESGEADVLYPLMRHLGRTMRPAKGLECLEVVTNPTLSEEARRGVVVAMAGESAPESFRRFVGLVFDHNRQSLFGEMARAYIRLYRKRKGITFVRVSSVVPLDGTTRERIEEIIRSQRGGEIEMEEIVDEGLLGGFILRVDGKVMDGSVKRAIELVRQQFINKNKTIV